MSVTIAANNGAGSVSPLTILSPYEASWLSRNVVHDLIGGGIAVSVVPANPRSGSYEALFDTEAEAWACAELHKAATTFTLTDTDTPRIDMTYVVTGDVRIALDVATLTVWTVTIGYQRVL